MPASSNVCEILLRIHLRSNAPCMRQNSGSVSDFGYFRKRSWRVDTGHVVSDDFESGMDTPLRKGSDFEAGR